MIDEPLNEHEQGKDDISEINGEEIISHARSVLMPCDALDDIAVMNSKGSRIIGAERQRQMAVEGSTMVPASKLFYESLKPQKLPCHEMGLPKSQWCDFCRCADETLMLRTSAQPLTKPEKDDAK